MSLQGCLPPLLGSWALKLWLLVAPATGTDPAQTPSSSPIHLQAQAAIARGKAAANQEHYTAALREFRTAAALEPSAALHFNVAVCEHNLMLAAIGEPETYERHRLAAIAGYQAYVDAGSDAADRGTVLALIKQLEALAQSPGPGPLVPGPPLVIPRLATNRPRELREVAIPKARLPPAVAPPGLDDAPIEIARRDASRSSTATTKSASDRVRIGPLFTVVLGHMAQLADSPLLPRTPMYGAGLRAGVFSGRKHRLNLGGELTIYGQHPAPSSHHGLVAGHAAFTLEYSVPVGTRRRFEFIVGGLAGLLGQAIRSSAPTPLTCAQRTAKVVAIRGGILVGPRLGFALLLAGRRRRHELGLRLSPALAGLGHGGHGTENGGETCSKPPFAQVALPGGAALVTSIDLGYGPRL